MFSRSTVKLKQTYREQAPFLFRFDVKAPFFTALYFVRYSRTFFVIVITLYLQLL